MIIDGFTFYNEFDMLECRLEYLYDHVDYFIISEADHSFSGKPKQFNYALNQARFEKYQDKILYAPLQIDPAGYNLDLANYSPDMLVGTGSDFWKIERQQRNNIASALTQFDDDAIVLIGDLDEIPNVNLFTRFSTDLNINKIIYFDMVGCQYNLKYQCGSGWFKSFVSTKEHVVRHTPDLIRAGHPHCYYTHGGWHLSYFMTPEQIKDKIENFSHQELNTPHWTDVNRIADCMANGRDVYDRGSFGDPTPREFYPVSFMNSFNRFYPEN